MTQDATLLEPGARARLGLRRGTERRPSVPTSAARWLLVEGGSGSISVDGRKTRVAGRADVFAGPGWSAWLAPGSDVRLTGDLRTSIVWRAFNPRTGGPCPPSRVIAPDEVVTETRGAGTSYERVVRTYLPEGPIIAGETLNPPGGWSSYPPHKHDTDSDVESSHEEVYLYRFSPPGGFGVAVQYDHARRDARLVYDGEATRISGGYHPVAAAPGYAMYYLWALAGERARLQPTFDPAHAWLA